jgi:hypothetical protein
VKCAILFCKKHATMAIVSYAAPSNAFALCSDHAEERLKLEETVWKRMSEEDEAMVFVYES